MRSLLLLLGNAPERQLSGDELEAALWPESDASTARTRLKVLVHRVRVLVRRDVLATSRSGYELTCTVTASLAGAARSLAEASGRETADAEHVAELERLVLALDARWPPRLLRLEAVAALAERLTELRARAYVLLLEALSRRGEPARAYEVAKGFVQANPYDEQARELQIRFAVQTGHQTEALRAYGAYQKMMSAEHGTGLGAAPRTCSRRATELTELAHMLKARADRPRV